MVPLEPIQVVPLTALRWYHLLRYVGTATALCARGKAKALTEFGAKIGASVVDGYTFIDYHSWDAYNECNDLALQIELYHKRFGCLPERIYADKIYLNRANRQLMKDLGIEAMGKPLGRPPKQVNPAHDIKMAKSVGERNEIEATFGTDK